MTCAIGGSRPRRLDLVDRADLPPGQFASLADVVADHLNLQRILAWMASPGVDAKVVDAVAQDEFTHDIVVRLAPDRWLVYDSG